MAESIAVCFKTARWPELHAVLPELAATGRNSGNWLYPPQGDHDVIAYEYDDILREYEPTDLNRLLAVLGGRPSAILCIEMKGSKGKAAVDSAASFALELLKRFEGAVDDLWSPSHIWTVGEIERGVEKHGKPFLGHYRDRLTR